MLFKAALGRHSLQQKALLAEVVKAAVDIEEAGTGCQHLSVQGNDFGSRGAAHIASYMRSSDTLQTLDVGQNGIGDTGATL